MGHAKEIYEGLGLSVARVALICRCLMRFQHSLAPPSPGADTQTVKQHNSGEKNVPESKSWFIRLARVTETLSAPSSKPTGGAGSQGTILALSRCGT